MIFKDDFDQLETVDGWEFCCLSDCIEISKAAVEVDSVTLRSGLVPPPKHTFTP